MGINSIGIDPGFSGAISLIDNDNNVTVIDMPVIATVKHGKTGKKTTKQELDGWAIADYLKMISKPVSITIEKSQTMPGQGIASSGRYMESYGRLRGICEGLGLSYNLVHPTTWKKVMMRDMGKGKGESIVKVKQLFPEVKLVLKRDHGKADAILLAAYNKIILNER